MNDANLVTSASSVGARWWMYFHQRFPIAVHGPVIAVFTWSAFAYAQTLRREPGLSPTIALAIAFVVVFLLFLQLRIADEFKDFEDDLRFRPYRPVPRGIVSLRSLGWLWFGAAAIQATASAMLGVRALGALVVVWAYSGLMAIEFFVRNWLKAHPLVYMASHMVIVPLIVAYVATCAGAQPMAVPLLWFAAASYLSFCVFEIGRKIRSPADEEEGVETYSALWGMRRAAISWVVAMAGAAVLAALAARANDAALLSIGVAAAVIALAITIAEKFLRDPKSGSGKTFLAISGVWLVTMFLALGVGAWSRI